MAELVDCLCGMHPLLGSRCEPCSTIYARYGQACDSSTQIAGVERSEVQGHSWLLSEFQANMGYIETLPPKKKNVIGFLISHIHKKHCYTFKC